MNGGCFSLPASLTLSMFDATRRGCHNHAMFTRYFLTPDGTKVAPQSGEDHANIGRHVLALEGIAPKDNEDIYNQMLALGFVRVAEYHGQICAENPVRELSAGQFAFLESIKFTSKRELLFNDRLFEETRAGRSLSHEVLITLDQLKDRQSGDRNPAV